MSDRFRGALTDAWKRIEERQWIYGKPGKLNADASYTYAVPGRSKFIYVTIRNAGGAQTAVPARNDALVPLDNNVVVKIRLEKGVYVIHGVSGRPEQGGVLPDSVGGGGSFLELSDAPSDYTGSAGLVVQVNALEDGLEFGAGAGTVDSVNGDVGTVVLDADDIDETASRIWFTTAEETKLAGIATGANNYSHPNHTGDVTSTGDGATVIAADVVTNAKLADMAANTVKVNATGSSANPTDTDTMTWLASYLNSPSFKIVPALTDYLALIDVAASNVLKRISLAALKTLITTYSGARVYNSADISIAHDTPTIVTFNSETLDTDSYHSTSSNTGRLTAPTAGKYLVTAHIVFAGVGTGGLRLASLYKNGTVLFASQQVNQDSTNPSFISVSSVIELAATDYVTVLATQTSGGALDVRRLASYSPEFTITKLGE